MMQDTNLDDLLDGMTTYRCTDSYVELEIDAKTAAEAAEEYVDGGDYTDGSETTWVDVWVSLVGAEDRDCITVTLHPSEPDCISGHSHDWQDRWPDGSDGNLGAVGHGGGVIIREACMHCGCGCETDTWAQRPDTGEQGLRSVAYEPGQYARKMQESRDDRS